MRRNILITGIGGDVGHSVIKCIKDKFRNANIIGCDINPYAVGRIYASMFYVAPKANDDENYGKFIDSLINQCKIKYIFPITEIEIIYFNKHRDYYEKMGVEVFINNAFIIDTFFDKYKTFLFLKEKGVSCPSTFLIKNYHGQLNYPLIMKPRCSCGNKNVFKIDNIGDLDFYGTKIDDGIIQEYVSTENEEYTTGVFSDGKEVHSITFKRKLNAEGFSCHVELVLDDKIDSIARLIAHESRLVGPLNLQSRKTSKGYCIFEINPRFSSTVYFRNYFGFHDVKWWINVAEKKAIDYKINYKKGIGVREFGETYFELQKA